MDIVYIGGKEYADAISVSAKSALRRARNPTDIKIHIVTNDVSFPDIGYDIRFWNGDSRNKWHGTSVVWARVDFPELFPDCDWVVSCDGDTLWLDDPENLWDERKDALLLQGSVDWAEEGAHPVNYYRWWQDNKLVMPKEKSYCCGLMLMNLKRMREVNFGRMCSRFLEKYPNPPQCEQTVMCYLSQNASCSLPREWGIFSFWHNEVMRPRLIHYVADLPWSRCKLNRLISDVVLLWWRECERLYLSNMPWQGYKGCKNRLDYVWRRIVYVGMKPFARFINMLPWLRPHFRNAKGFTRAEWKVLLK